jgi:hypothetical protein
VSAAINGSARTLNAEDAELLGAPRHGIPKALHHLRPKNCFMEQVSLLDPVHFRLHLQFGQSNDRLNRALGAFYGLALGDALGMLTQS